MSNYHKEVIVLFYCLENLQYLHQLIVNHVRGLSKFFVNNDIAERYGKGTQSPNAMRARDLHNHRNYVWT